MAAEKDARQVNAPVFVQTEQVSIKELDRFRQVGEEEARAVYDMIMRGELSGGTQVVRDFEADWRRFVGLDYSLTTVNGTTSLYSAYFGVGVGPGDEVLCPTFTWICTISPVPLLGARPVFCESDPNTMMIDPEDMKRRITRKTKAVVVVHLWGWVCDMDPIMDIARKAGIAVIEDCSHAHGALYKGKVTGSIGDVACWSLQGSKPVTAGEGGVLATDNVEIFERACLIGQVNRIKGMDLVTTRYQDFQPLGTGMKFRAHPLAMGIARIQLAKLPELNRRRLKYVEEIEAGLADIPGLYPIATVPGTTRGGLYMYPIRFKSQELGGVSLKTFAKALSERGMKSSGCPYTLLHRQPYFARGFDLFTGGRGPLIEGWQGYKEGDFPATERMFDELLFIPRLSDPVPGAAQVVLKVLRETAEKARRGQL